MRLLLEQYQLEVDELLNLKLKGPTVLDVVPRGPSMIVTPSIPIKT
ncbi:hypothetical protein A2U01_0095635, partial [Trifolium medium]|nr:hypothetical protein [Trifolium medium]